MHYLGLAVTGEGPTDHRFLSPVIRRTAEHLCLQHGTSSVDIGPVLEFPDYSTSLTEGDYLGRIVTAAQAAHGAVAVICIHRDAGTDARAARENAVTPIVDALTASGLLAGVAAVALVPIRETEAWTIADGDALRKVFGTSLANDDLGLPRRARDVENETDPKRVLDRAYSRVIGGWSYPVSVVTSVLDGDFCR